jgi:DNA-binding transcriptional LysR family regulator
MDQFQKMFSEGGLSLDRLRNFCLVAEKGGIARACEGDLSRQALISRQIRELEVFFGSELTRRKGKGIELTQAGEELARQVRLHLQGLADFKVACLGAPMEFRIGAGNSLLE